MRDKYFSFVTSLYCNISAVVNIHTSTTQAISFLLKMVCYTKYSSVIFMQATQNLAATLSTSLLGNPS